MVERCSSFSDSPSIPGYSTRKHTRSTYCCHKSNWSPPNTWHNSFINVPLWKVYWTILFPEKLGKIGTCAIAAYQALLPWEGPGYEAKFNVCNFLSYLVAILFAHKPSIVRFRSLRVHRKKIFYAYSAKYKPYQDFAQISCQLLINVFLSVCKLNIHVVVSRNQVTFVLHSPL